MPKKLLFSGNSLSQALLAAARSLRLDPDQIAYRDRSKHSGFLGSPRVVIEVDPATPLRSDGVIEPPVVQRPQAPRARPISRISAAREEELQALAAAAVTDFRSTGQEVLTAEMNPAERRIVHSAVSDLGLHTESLGDERLKRIRIYLRESGPGSEDGAVGSNDMR